MTASKQNRMMHPQSTDARRNAQQVKIEALKVEVAQLELDLHGEDPELIVKRHIELLHLYNERKVGVVSSPPLPEVDSSLFSTPQDATQIMIGEIATIEGCTVKEVQEKLGIDLDD